MLYFSRIIICISTILFFSGCEHDADEALSFEGNSSDLSTNAHQNESLVQEGFSDLVGDRLALANRKKHGTHRCGCQKVLARLSSTAQINPPLLTATGPMVGTLRGTVNYEAYLADIVEISSGFGNDPVNSTASFTGTWTLTNKKGTLTFRDVGVFEQIPNSLGTSFSRVINGTGIYTGASGFLFLNFISDDTGLSFEEILRGEIYCGKHSIK